MEKDIRWKQRFQNLDKAFTFLAGALQIENPSELEQAGIIQAYEFTFELSWKTLKDFLEYNKIEAVFPRDVIKESFKNGLIDDGDIWMDMLDKRNLIAHTYNDDNARTAILLIRNKYFLQLEKLYGLLVVKKTYE